MLGQRRLAQGNAGVDLTDRARPIEQRAQHEQPLLIAERLEQRRGQGGVLLDARQRHIGVLARRNISTYTSHQPRSASTLAA